MKGSQLGPFALMPVWMLKHNLNGAEWATLISLRSFADRESGHAFPSVKTIADRAQISDRSCARALAKLRGVGLVVSTQRFRDDGSVGGCDYYVIDVDPDPDTQTCQGVVTDLSGGGDRSDRRGGDRSVRARTDQFEQTKEPTTSHAAPPRAAEEVVDAEIIEGPDDQPTNELPLDVPAAVARQTDTQQLVAAYADAVTSAGGVMTRQTAGIIGKAVKRLIDVDGIEPALIHRAVQLAGARRSKDLDRFLGAVQQTHPRGGQDNADLIRIWAERYGEGTSS